MGGSAAKKKEYRAAANNRLGLRDRLGLLERLALLYQVFLDQTAAAQVRKFDSPWPAERY